MLSPFYKPNHEDLRIGAVYDAALIFTHGAQELRDATKTLEAMMARPSNPQQQKEIHQLQETIRQLSSQLSESSQRLAETLKPPPGRERLRR